MGKKNKAAKTRDQKLPAEPAGDLSENSTGPYSLVGNKLIVAVFLFLISFLVFVPSLSNGFVWDDVSYIQKKASSLDISRIGPELFVSNLDKGKSGSKYFRPLFKASLIIDNEIWNTSPFGFHLTNIILYSISTVLLYFLALLVLSEFRVRGREPIAFMSCVLFALYPLHVESVSFISARGDILASIFFFLSLIFYIKSYKKFFYLLLAAVCFFLSFISKEVALALPIVIFGFDLVSRRLVSRANLMKYTVLGLITLLYFSVRSKSYLGIGEIVERSSHDISQGFMYILELVSNAYFYYIVKLVFPYNLNPFIDVSLDGGLFRLIISIILILALFAVVVVSMRRKENITAFSILWVLATLIPAAAITVLPLAATKLADRFMYIPSAGICILLAYLIYELGRVFKIKWVSFTLTAVLALSFAVVTINAQQVWKSNATLWKYAVEQSPNAAGAKINYADALRNTGKSSEALKYYLEVHQNVSELTQRAKLMTAHGIVATSIDTGKYQNAKKWLDVALSYNEKYLSQYYYLLGFISLKQNDPQSAEDYFIKSTEIRNNKSAYYLLGGIYYVKAEKEQSLDMYRKSQAALMKVIKIDPRFSQASLLLAKTYVALGDTENAQRYARSALEHADSQNVIDEANSILQMK